MYEVLKSVKWLHDHCDGRADNDNDIDKEDTDRWDCFAKDFSVHIFCCQFASAENVK